MITMDFDTLLLSFFAGLGFSAIVISFIFLVYIRLTRIRQIDKLVYGYEFPNDNLVAFAIRATNYAGAFTWKWSAKRGGLEKVIEQFDFRYKWPFVVFFIMMFTGIVFIIIAYVLKKYFGV